MTSNAEAAERLRAIADLLDVLGERFKPEAYRRAARTIETLSEELSEIARRDELTTLPGIGAAIAEKLREYLATGTIPYYERLRAEVPPGVVELLHLPGLGPKTARRFWQELGIDGPESLRAAIEAGRLAGFAGFKDRKIDNLRQALAPAASGPGRLPLDAVYPLALRLVEGLRRAAPVDVATIAGSFRRGRESVGDLDVLVTSTAPERVFDAFATLPEVREVRLRGPTKSTVTLANGLQADLRVVEPSAYGAALQYFTGSKDHNVQLRSLARDRGLKVNEYGVFRDATRIAGRTEEEVYAALGVRWIPPELREGRDEIERASRGPLPGLIEAPELVAEAHLHLAEDAGPREVTSLREAARSRGLEQVTVVVAGVHGDGSAWEVPPGVLAALEDPSPGGPRFLLAQEPGWDRTVPEAPASRASCRILRADRSPPPAGPLPEGLPPRLLAHLAPSTESRGRAAEIALARRWKLPLEIGPGPDRLDPTAGRAAGEAGVPIAIPTGVGRPADDPLGPVALAFARRAALVPGQVVNARGARAARGPGARRNSRR